MLSASHSQYEKYKLLLDLYSEAHISTSKSDIQKAVNDLWGKLKKNAVEYDAKIQELQDKKNLLVSRSLSFWAQLPKGNETSCRCCRFNLCALSLLD